MPLTTLERNLSRLCFLILLIQCSWADYQVGIGIADCTGPIAEVPFMGYAKSTQKGTGLHLRQFARAFVLEDGTNRIAFVSVDAAMVGYGLRKQVLHQLEKRFGNTYNEHNFVLSGTHTHSAPGGFMMHILFDFTSFGFVKETFTALSTGIVKAVVRAHRSMKSAKIYLNSGEVVQANINRSPLAYLLNPEAERERYASDTDKEMVQLKFVSSPSGKPLGTIQWFPVHPTSMNNTNTLVSSDNVGYASVLLEQHVNKNRLIGKGPFVAAFASTSLGDVSPNTRGPSCLNTGETCDNVSSTCDGEAKICVASGPGKDMFESTRIIARRLYEKALELMEDGQAREVTGPLRIRLRYVDMPSQEANFTTADGSSIQVRGCLPAMGYSFAAGTTDGPGEFDFKQGTLTDNKLWNTIRNFLAQPTPEDIACHHPKPILLATGRIKVPYEWQPRIVPIQAATIGDVVLLPVPGEFTTMSGRRLREAVAKVVAESGGSKNAKVIIAGLSNVYSDYIVTPEEYQLQRYEGASTIFGPHTLTLYLHLYGDLVESLFKERQVEMGPQPSDLSKNLVSLIPPVIFDWPGWSSEFGYCLKQPLSTYRLGDTVVAKFVAGHPRNNVMHGKTFLAIEKAISDDDWIVIATDANWETKFKWQRTSFLIGTSEATVEWTIGTDVEPGFYRIRHFGHYKYTLGGIFPYEGLTENFRVI